MRRNETVRTRTARTDNATSVVAQRPPSRSAGLGEAIAFEWIKLRTVRSTWWILLSGPVLVAAIGVVLGMSMAASGDNGFDVSRPSPHAAMEGILLAQLPFVALATLAMTTEYSTGSIRFTLQSVPVRARMLLAKLVVVTTLAFLSGVALCLVGTAAVAPFASHYGVFTAAELGWTALAGGCYLALLGAFTLGLGSLLRSAAGTITTVTMMLLAVPQLLRASTIDWLTNAGDYLPDTAGTVLTTQGGEPYSVVTAALVLLAWASTTMLAGYHRLRTRDA